MTKREDLKIEDSTFVVSVFEGSRIFEKQLCLAFISQNIFILSRVLTHKVLEESVALSLLNLAKVYCKEQLIVIFFVGI